MAIDDRSRPRLIDVAKAAGVSVSTASRALGRGSDLISATKRDHIRQIAREMGYQVNTLARSLRLSSSGNIGMVVPSVSNPFFMDLVEKVESVLAGRGLNLLLSNSQMSLVQEDKHLHALESGAVDGLLIVPCHQTYSAPAIERTSALVPTVQLDRPIHGIPLPTVGVDDEHGMKIILEHLKDLGVHRIALLSNTSSDLSSDIRNQGAVAYARKLNIDLPEEFRIQCSFSVEAGSAAVHKILQHRNHPQAIVCLNDQLAIGAITQLRRAGIAIPTDIKVTGFDDIQFAKHMRPSITTLRQPLDEIARISVDILLSDERIAQHTPVPGKLIVRESTVL